MPNNKGNIKRDISENKQFFLMFVITYLITIFLSLIIAICSLDEMISEELLLNQNSNFNHKSFLDMCDLIDGKLQFYNCKNLDVPLYIGAKIIETIVPTTITFCGTILVLQLVSRKNMKRDTILFSLLVCLTIAGMAFTAARSIAVLIFHLITIIVLFIACLGFSRKIYYSQNSEQVNHKIERSDGKMIRN